MQQPLLAGLVLSLWMGAPCAGQSSVGWSDLVDAQAQTFEDPFAELTYQQLDHLRTIIRARERLNDDGLSDEDRARFGARLTKAETAMAQSGLDVDWLLSQRWSVAERRETAATAANPALDGKTVTLAGFAIPAPPGPGDAATAYLVSEPGACSHMPPPNPNQMVRVQLPDGWTPSANHVPVRLTGRLTISPTEHVVRVVDGPVKMRASFAMDVSRVETLPDFRAAARRGHQGLRRNDQISAGPK
jgi:hypothetical protein